MTRTIADVIRRDCGFALEVPEGNGWLRLVPCPYCGRSGGTANRGAQRPPASVNHSLGWFQCFACGVRRSATYDDSPATRFRAVLKQAAWSAHQTFPGVLPEDEARSHANERLAIYAGPDDGAWADSGALERWEKKAADEQDSLDRFVLHALNCDLLDYGRKLLRQHRREKPVGDGQQSVTMDAAGAPDPLLLDHLTHLIDSRGFEEWEQLRDSGQFNQEDYPLLFATKVDLFTREELSEITGIPVSTIRNRLAGEKAKMAAAFVAERGWE